MNAGDRILLDVGREAAKLGEEFRLDITLRSGALLKSRRVVTHLPGSYVVLRCPDDMNHYVVTAEIATVTVECR